MLIGALLPEADNEFATAAELVAELARRSARYSFQRIQLLHAGDRFALAFVAADERRLGGLVASDPTAPVRVWCHLHKVAPLAARQAAAEEAADFARGRPPLRASNRTLVAWDEASGRVDIATDRLGLSAPFVGRRGRGFVFSPDFAAVASLCRPRPRPDLDSALLQFCFGYAPDDSTLFDAVRSIGPRTLLTLEAGSCRERMLAPAIYSDAHFGADRRRLFEALDGACEAAASHWLDGDPPFLVSFSAGFDSRYGLALAHARGQRPALWTFGQADSEEVTRARAIAQGVDALIHNLDSLQNTWEGWCRCTEQLGSLAMNQWAGWGESWLAALREQAPAVVIGYIGDTLSGKWMPRDARPGDDWIGHWIGWSLDRVRMDSELLMPGAGRRALELVRERFEGLAKGAETAAPFQVAQHLNLSGRQRRQTGNQPSLIERFMTPLTFFTDDALLDVWSGVPLNELLGQRLYLDYAASRFPRLFGAARLRTQGYTWRARIVARLRSGGRPPASRPPVVDNARPLTAHRDAILATIDRMRPDWSAVFDLGRLRQAIQEVPLGSGMPQLRGHVLTSLVNLAILDNAVPQ